MSKYIKNTRQEASQSSQNLTKTNVVNVVNLAYEIDDDDNNNNNQNDDELVQKQQKIAPNVEQKVKVRRRRLAHRRQYARTSVDRHAVVGSTTSLESCHSLPTSVATDEDIGVVNIGLVSSPRSPLYAIARPNTFDTTCDNYNYKKPLISTTRRIASQQSTVGGESPFLIFTEPNTSFNLNSNVALSNKHSNSNLNSTSPVAPITLSSQTKKTISSSTLTLTYRSPPAQCIDNVHFNDLFHGKVADPSTLSINQSVR